MWLEISLIAPDLIAWTQHLALDDDLALCAPKALRYRLLHTAARLLTNPVAHHDDDRPPRGRLFAARPTSRAQNFVVLLTDAHFSRR